MAKQGVFDTASRKVVGILDEVSSSVISVNGESVRIDDILEPYKGCDITITVGQVSEIFTEE